MTIAYTAVSKRSRICGQTLSVESEDITIGSVRLITPHAVQLASKASTELGFDAAGGHNPEAGRGVRVVLGAALEKRPRPSHRVISRTALPTKATGTNRASWQKRTNESACTSYG